MITKTTQHYFLRSACLLTYLLFNIACDDHQTEPEPDTFPIPTANDRLLLGSTFAFGLANAAYNKEKMPEKFQFTDLGQDVVINYTPAAAVYVISEGGQIKNKLIYTLKNGVAQSRIDYEVGPNGKESVIGTVTYIYKAGKLHKTLTMQNGQVAGSREYYYDNANENVIMMEDYDKDGVLTVKITFEYTNILDKSGSFNEWNVNMDGTLFPRKSKYLVKKKIIDFGSFVQEANMSYVLDLQGYVISGEEATPSVGTYTWTNKWI